MHNKVREIKPLAVVTEEIDAVEPARLEAPSPGPRDAAPEVVDSIDVMPDLGPNGPLIQRVLQRAGLLSRGELDRLATAAETGWWPISLPAGGASGGPRATAVIKARGAGLGRAVVWLDHAAEAAASNGTSGRRRPLVVRAIANAGLALLVRDRISEEAFDTLFGPWREVTHQ